MTDPSFEPFSMDLGFGLSEWCCGVIVGLDKSIDVRPDLGGRSRKVARDCILHLGINGEGAVRAVPSLFAPLRFGL